MVLKVAPGVPLVWRSPSSLQFGVDRSPIVLDELDEGGERLIAALVPGISRSGFDMMARTLGVAPDRAAALLDRLEPVLVGGDAPPARHVAVTGDGPLAEELRRMLRTDEPAASAGSAPELAVLVAGWVIAPEDHGSWLRRDIPHLPVVIGDGGVTVGPVVEPGAGPCLYCVQLARTDDDPAWPAIAAQLWTRPAPELSRLAIAEAAAFVARLVAERLRDGPAVDAVSRRLASFDGRVSARGWTRHAACRCAARPESDWLPDAAPATPSATTRAAAAGVPA